MARRYNRRRRDAAIPDDAEDLIDRIGFQDPGGESALRRATRLNPRTLPCPTCGRKDMLTPADQARGYQCDVCAAIEEGRWPMEL